MTEPTSSRCFRRKNAAKFKRKNPAWEMPSLLFLQRRLDYDPDTGFLTWRRGRGKGDRAERVWKDGSLVVDIDGSWFTASKIIMRMMRPLLFQQQHVVDHLNGDKQDNRYVNLQLRHRYNVQSLEHLNPGLKVAEAKHIHRGPKRAVLMPDIDQFRALFNYDPETGFLTWRPGAKNRKGRPPADRTMQGVGKPNEKGYRKVQVLGRVWFVHRIAYAMHHNIDPGVNFIDHINRDPSDNRIENLRMVSHSENLRNRDHPRRMASKSGILGVAVAGSKWMSYIPAQHGGKRIHVGTFDTPEQAREAVNIVRAELNLPLV